MEIKNTYRKAVNKLPINSKKKNFLIRNWTGALLLPFLFIISMATNTWNFPVMITTIFDYIEVIFRPIYFVQGIIGLSLGPIGAGVVFIISIILLSFIGAFIQSILRKVL